jgi:hypothetical protein
MTSNLWCLTFHLTLICGGLSSDCGRKLCPGCHSSPEGFYKPRSIAFIVSRSLFLDHVTSTLTFCVIYHLTPRSTLNIPHMFIHRWESQSRVVVWIAPNALIVQWRGSLSICLCTRARALRTTVRHKKSFTIKLKRPFPRPFQVEAGNLRKTCASLSKPKKGYNVAKRIKVT